MARGADVAVGGGAAAGGRAAVGATTAGANIIAGANLNAGANVRTSQMSGGSWNGRPAGSAWQGNTWNGNTWNGRVATNSWNGRQRDWDWNRRRFARSPGVAFGFGPSYVPYYDDYAYATYPYDDYAYNDYPNYSDTYAYYGGETDVTVNTAADPAYCMQRYRSYDPASGTFLGYDGLRHPCP